MHGLITGPCRVTSTSSTTGFLRPRTRISSRTTSPSTHSPSYEYCDAFSGFTFSTYRSSPSTIAAVSPHAMRSLCPMSTSGVDGRQAPAAFSSGESTWYSQNSDGICNGRCGSLASSGLPVVDFFPFTAQLLLMPGPVSAPERSPAMP